MKVLRKKRRARMACPLQRGQKRKRRTGVRLVVIGLRTPRGILINAREAVATMGVVGAEGLEPPTYAL